jgi:GTP-binding protein Era
MMPEAETCRSGWIAIIGRPNVGKSTLLNRLVGQKLAITSAKAQTTRHTIVGIKTWSGGQMVFVDTPGIHERGSNALNRYRNRAALTTISEVDLVLLVVEAGRWTGEDDKALQAIQAAGTPAIAVINKIDRIRDKAQLLPFIERLAARYAFRELIPVSAARGDQLDRLDALLSLALPERPLLFPEEQITDRPERFFAAELVREQLMRRYGDELPYQAAVEIEHFEDLGGRYRIHALIWVERPGQKAIIIGERGEALKAAATEARQQMQRLFECPVHLEVWVKVRKSWSGDDAALSSLGYRER